MTVKETLEAVSGGEDPEAVESGLVIYDATTGLAVPPWEYEKSLTGEEA